MVKYVLMRRIVDTPSYSNYSLRSKSCRFGFCKYKAFAMHIDIYAMSRYIAKAMYLDDL